MNVVSKHGSMESFSTSPCEGPSWDNSTEYSGLDGQDFEDDLGKAQELITEINRHTPVIREALAENAVINQTLEQLIATAQQCTVLFQKAKVLLGNARTFVSCELSVDGKNSAAKAKDGVIRSLDSKLRQAFNPITLFLVFCHEDAVESYLQSPHTKARRFLLSEQRKRRHQTLSIKEEDMLVALGVDGHTAWASLYTNLSGSIACQLRLPDGKEEVVGLAKAASLLQDENEGIRKAAFQGIQSGWRSHEESCAAILNALSGWRLEVCRRRSHTTPVHFLDQPLHDNKIQKETLETMMDAVREARFLGQSVLELQAQLFGKRQLDPWDLQAPSPKLKTGTDWRKLPFDEGIKLIKQSFAQVSPDMSSFVDTMVKNRWIEGRIGQSKRPGAYCTKFVKSRTPRVYMTYAGGMQEVKTLAHELGHAFHNWVMRDMPLEQTYYPMTLAETASIFAETLVNQSLLAKVGDSSMRLTYLWGAVREVESLLLNVPARFDFERAFYQRRKDGPLDTQEFKKLMREAWGHWYGNSLSEADEMFWASKLHFYISNLSFYNFPYTFGYLFSLGVYAQREKWGEQFYAAYVSLLRDTAQMSAEELAYKHLGVDLTQPDFWQESLGVVAKNVDSFRKIAEELSATND